MSLGLQTARALVIDDNYHEAQPVLLALSRLGIGSVYLNGNVEQLSKNDGFRGIRLAFVDMDLQGDGSAPHEDLGRQAAGYLAKALSPDNGMLAALLWTKHPAAAQSFYAELRELLPRNAVLEMGVDRKPTNVAGSDQETQEDAVRKILTHVTGWLEGAPGVRLLWEWEQVAHEAVTGTTENLIEVVSKGRKTELSSTESVSSGLTSTLGLLSSAARVRKPTTGIEAAAQAFSALVPILEDGAEQASERFRSIDEQNLAGLLSAANDPELSNRRSPEERAEDARLNRMVHVSRRPLPGAPLLPGNVYEIRGKLATALPFRSDRLLDSIMGNGNDQVGDGIRPIPIIAEVSPACDYANAKAGVPRVLGGALVPKARLKKIPRHDYIYGKPFGVFRFDENEVDGLAAGVFHFAFNARFFTGVSDKSLKKRTPLFRIRHNTLVDLQGWLARYGSRAGVITIAS